MPMKGLRVWSLIILAVAAREHATDDAERRRRCVTEPETGFGIGRWVEGADDAARAISNIYGLDAATHPVVRWRWVPDNPECALRAPPLLLDETARAQPHGALSGGCDRTCDALCAALARASCRVLFFYGDSIQSGLFKTVRRWLLGPSAGPRGQRAIRWQWGAFGAVEHACASGWNVSVFFLSTNKYSHAMRRSSVRGWQHS